MAPGKWFGGGSAGTRGRRVDPLNRPLSSHPLWSSIPDRKLVPRGSAGRSMPSQQESRRLGASQSPLSRPDHVPYSAVMRQSFLASAPYPGMAMVATQRPFVARPSPDEGPVTFDTSPRAMSPCPPPRNAGPEKVQNPLKARRLRMQMRWYHDFHYNSVEHTPDPSTIRNSFTAAAPASPAIVCKHNPSVFLLATLPPAYIQQRRVRAALSC